MECINGEDKKTSGRGELEDKEAFVDAVVTALVEHGAGRYGYLEDNPVRYLKQGGQEWLATGTRRMCVSGDSLTALLSAIREMV